MAKRTAEPPKNPYTYEQWIDLKGVVRYWDGHKWVVMPTDYGDKF